LKFKTLTEYSERQKLSSVRSVDLISQQSISGTFVTDEYLCRVRIEWRTCEIHARIEIK